MICELNIYIFCYYQKVYSIKIRIKTVNILIFKYSSA